MASSGARTQRPVGSAAWVSTEKENISQLVEQEMEEVEYPVAHEMDWLNEHMAEIFENNNFNFTEVFKTPGKLRGKTPRTARKRNVDDPRMPLSEVFSAAHNQVESRPNASPATKRSPAKTAAPTTTTNAKNARQQQPQYPSLPQNLNSFSQYNTDSGYHGLEQDDDNDNDDDDNDGDDDVVLTQVQSESQASTQPLDSQPWKNETDLDTSPVQASSTGRRMSESSFHSAREDRETTAEPPIVDSNAHKKTNARHPAPQSKQRELESSPVVSKPERETQAKRSFDKKAEKAEQKPEQKQKEAKPAPKPAPKPAQNTRAAKPQPRQQPEPEPESSPQPEPRSESVEIPKSSPAKTPATQPRAQRHEEEEENYDDGDREDMELDGLDDIGSPSDGSTPERPPIRKSSLTFASLPAREPLKKSLGPRMSRTSHIDVGKINGTGNSGVLGRQTGGHRTTQAGLDEQAQGDKMDVDDAGASREYGEDETRASKLHNKSSTQRLHEKISMLGKLQPSRPTKSIPNVSNLSSAHVSYPELPSVNNKADGKPDTANRGSREMPAGDPMATDEDEWIKPLNTPQRPNLAKSQTFDVADKSHKASDRRFERDTSAARDHSMDEDRPTKPTENLGGELYRKSTTPVHSPPKRPMHQKSASVFNTAGEVSTTPIGSPRHQDVPLSASKWKLQSIMKSAKGLFSSTGGVSNAARVEASSPDESREPPAVESSTPTKSEGRETRGSAEREEKRKQKELEDRQRAEEAEREEKAREQQEKQKAAQLKAAQEKASQEQEREASAPSPKRIPQLQKQPSKEPEPATETNASASTSTKSGIPPPASSQQTQQKQNERRPVKPTREPLQKPKPQPVSIRVGSALSRQIPMAPGSNVQESSAPTAPTPASASKPAAPPSTLKKKASNNSLHTVPSNSSFKSSVSSTSQRKAQLASERKKEQEEREARRKEEQKREVERKRAAQQQQQEEARRQEMRSRAEAEKRDRERQASEDPKKAAHMQAIEKRRLENARRLERQGSQQPSEPERPASQASRPASRLGSVQPFNRSVNQPQPNPAKPPKRAMDDEPSNRPAPSKPSAVQPSGETKRRRTEDEHNPPPSVRPTMAPPIRQSTIRKEPKKPSLAGHSKHSMLNSAQASGHHQSGSSIFKTAQPQRPAHPMDMSKYASGKIPFSEAQQSGLSKTPGGGRSSSAQKPATRPSPKYPSGENIHLPEIATDSEDDDSESDMLPMPKWARPEELEVLLREQEGMEVDSIFGPIAPFSLEETFKTDKRIKKFRERTSSANWSGADRLTQDEIRKDLAERQRLRLNGGWSFEAS